jgi:4-hydroxythreonine-4-phosphate dehydrogenase
MTLHQGQLPLAVTMGEPAGIGPELIARIWRNRHELALPPFVYIGSSEALKVADPELPFQIVTSVEKAETYDDHINIIEYQQKPQ